MARSGIAVVLALAVAASVMMEAGEAAVIKNTADATRSQKSSGPQKPVGKSAPSSPTVKSLPAAARESSKKSQSGTPEKAPATTVSPLPEFEADELIPFNGHLSS